jgi:quercetin dioxygenase-like cupin family protein
LLVISVSQHRNDATFGFPLFTPSFHLTSPDVVKNAFETRAYVGGIAAAVHEDASVMIATRLFATCMLAALGGGSAVAQTTAPAAKQVLLKATGAWNGSAYVRYPAGRPELTTLRLAIPPRTALPSHTHPFPEVGYVASGAITIEDGRTGKHHTFRTGQAFAETVNAVHRGVTGAQPTILIITYVGTPGVPTSIPARGAGKEY